VVALTFGFACEGANDPFHGELGVAVNAAHAWDGFHWARTANPFTLDLGDNLTTAVWKQILADQVSPDWSATGVLDTTVVAGSGAMNCRAVRGRIEVCNRPRGFNGWLGLATIWTDRRRHIVRATAQLNDTYFDADPSLGDPVARRHVMCQEVGHALALDHQLGASCMNTSNLGHPDYDSPDAHDYEQLGTIYGHGDGYTTVAARADGPDEDPAALPRDESRRASLFVKEVGDETMWTWVLWAPGAR
jgi:hypothetical protein